jgi:predicted 2-oxoglutarate/Fe(II)-dependent dioxygenase YbiX/peroxiredoxin
MRRRIGGTGPPPRLRVRDDGAIEQLTDGVREQAPAFSAPALNGNPRYGFDSAAGRPILMLFMGSGAWPPNAAALALIARHRALFDDVNASFFGVTIDPQDAAESRIAQHIPGIRWFLDYDTAISSAYGAARQIEGRSGYYAHWLLLDSLMRVVARAPIADGEKIFAILAAMVARGPEQSSAPVLAVPRIFEPELCRQLIEYYERKGGGESGFMQQDGTKTVGRFDHSFKRRLDCPIDDEALRDALHDRLYRRLVPQIRKAFQFQATRIERWVVACYDSDSGGFFRPHRDDTTAATAHRAFACSINLNAEAYEGGDLRFPEFGPRTYRPATGGAVIFSCSLLHEATPVTNGRRYAFLPFFYDEVRARLRERNRIHLEEATENILVDQS